MHVRQKKMPNFISPDNLEKFKKYWDNSEFQKMGSQNKKNHNIDVDGVGPSLHTCGFIPMSKWHLRLIRILYPFLIRFSLFTSLTHYLYIICYQSHLIENSVSMNDIRTHNSTYTRGRKTVGCVKNLRRNW